MQIKTVAVLAMLSSILQALPVERGAVTPASKCPKAMSTWGTLVLTVVQVTGSKVKRDDADAAYLIPYKDKRDDADAAYLIPYKEKNKRDDADAAYLIPYKEKERRDDADAAYLIPY
jgi:hypothetical protein